MSTIRRFEELDAWITARELCNQIGVIIDTGGFNRNYKLVGQIEGSSGSIMDNIAEGFERGTRGEFILFLGYAKGSCGELRSQLYRALDRNYITQTQFDQLFNLAARISAMLQSLISYLLKSEMKGARKNHDTPSPNPQTPEPLNP